MSPDEPLDLQRVDQEIRINELRCEAEELAGGSMTAWEAEDCPPEIAEQFWQNVVQYEKTAKDDDAKHIDLLRERGIDLPDPAGLSDEAVSAKLQEVIHALADLDTYLHATDHLSDRELYHRLWSDVLHEFTYPGMTTILDLVSGGSEQDIDDWLRYYANDETRNNWKAEWPDHVMPPKEKPAFDRDRHLPTDSELR